MNGDSKAFMNALRGPIIMITIGVLFLLDKFTPFQFGQTWPVILIVLGVLALAGGGKRVYYPGPGGSPGMPPNRPPGPPPGSPPPGVRR